FPSPGERGAAAVSPESAADQAHHSSKVEPAEGTAGAMTLWITLAIIAIAAMLSLFFATLTFALRDLSRPKLEIQLKRRNMVERWLEKTLAVRDDLAFVTAVLRLIANILLLVGVLHFLLTLGWPEWA